MNLIKTIFFILAGLYLGSIPILSYYFVHGPACPCHSIIGKTKELAN
ncbi:hypothetical protein M901_0662 [Bacteriovorax sp. DB6_IX]|nr:hypothetical protein M901_0662 [Bacteriovorax sp. DB6_IX]